MQNIIYTIVTEVTSPNDGIITQMLVSDTPTHAIEEAKRRILSGNISNGDGFIFGHSQVVCALNEKNLRKELSLPDFSFKLSVSSAEKKDIFKEVLLQKLIASELEATDDLMKFFTKNEKSYIRDSIVR